MINERRKCLGGFGSDNNGFPLSSLAATDKYLGYKNASDQYLSNANFIDATAANVSPVDFEAEHQAKYEHLVLECLVTETEVHTEKATGVQVTLESSADGTTWVEDGTFTIPNAKLVAGGYVRNSLSNDTHRYLRAKVKALGTGADYTKGKMLMVVRPLN
jgi:hypothetical protein